VAHPIPNSSLKAHRTIFNILQIKKKKNILQQNNIRVEEKNPIRELARLRELSAPLNSSFPLLFPPSFFLFPPKPLPITFFFQLFGARRTLSEVHIDDPRSVTRHWRVGVVGSHGATRILRRTSRKETNIYGKRPTERDQYLRKETNVYSYEFLWIISDEFSHYSFVYRPFYPTMTRLSPPLPCRYSITLGSEGHVVAITTNFPVKMLVGPWL